MFSFQLSLGVTSKMTSAIDSNAELRKCMTSLGFSFSDDTSKKIKAFLMCNKPKGKGKIYQATHNNVDEIQTINYT
jgi:hypothetical protein